MPETGPKAGNTVNIRRLVAALADTAPVVVLAAIAGAGSFTHIRATAAQHGQGGPMSWAVAVCIDFSELAFRDDQGPYVFVCPVACRMALMTRLALRWSMPGRSS
jgi:hypothetical protein